MLTIPSLPLLLIPAALAGCAGSRGALDPRETHLETPVVVLPTRDCGEGFFVDVYLDGYGPFALALDTAFQGLSLTLEASRRLPRWIRGEARVKSLRIGGLELHDVGFTEVDLQRLALELGTPMDGVLGFRAFQDLLLTLDYPAREVRVTRGRLVEGDQTVVFRAEPRPFVPLQIGRRRWSALLDTATTAAILLPTLEGLELEAPPVFLGRGLTVAGSYEKHSARAASTARLGPIELQRPVVTRSSGPPRIGTQILRNFAVTFDQNRRLVRFARSGRGPLTTPPVRTTGVLLDRTAGSWTVSGVLPGSPAAGAGLRGGDRILAVDGRPVGEIGCDHWTVLGAEEVTFTVQRDRRRFQVHLVSSILVR